MDKGWAIGEMVLINGQISPTWQQGDFCSQEWKLMCPVCRTNDDLLLTVPRDKHLNRCLLCQPAYGERKTSDAQPHPNQRR
jgi:hypothetical protein